MDGNNSELFGRKKSKTDVKAQKIKLKRVEFLSMQYFMP